MKVKGKKNKDRKKQRSGTSYSESVRDKQFCCMFKLGFVQLICKASLIFNLNLELALSIILKERALHESKNNDGIQIIKNIQLIILFDTLFNPRFKMTSFANVARTTATQVNLYTREDFKSSGIGSIYKK